MTAYALDHVAFAVNRWDDGRPVLAELLGGRWRHGFELDAFSPCQLRYGNDMRIEMLAPGRAAGSFVQRYLDQNDGRNQPHHITFKVKDIRATMRLAENEGVEPILVNLAQPGWQEAFFHPRQTGLGFLVQIAQTDNAEPADSGSPDLRESPWPDPLDRSPAQIVSIVAHVADIAFAARFVEKVLGATVTSKTTQDRDITVCHWPAGAALVLLPLAADTDRPRITHVGVRTDRPLSAVAIPVAGGWTMTDPVPELGVRLLIAADETVSAATIS